MKEEGKPEHIIQKIIAGRMDKFYRTSCLLEQPYIKDEEMTVSELLKTYIGIIKENIVISSFSRFVA